MITTDEFLILLRRYADTVIAHHKIALRGTITEEIEAQDEEIKAVKTLLLADGFTSPPDYRLRDILFS